MTPVPVPADRRFRRAHVKPARVRSGWGVVLWRSARYALVAGLLVAGAGRIAKIVAHADVLHVDHIVVHGNERLTSGDVLAVLNGLRGQSLISTDLEYWRRRLMSSPWILDATLRRSLPSTVDVTLSERQPIGIARLQGQMFLVDARGWLMDEYGPQYAELDLPIVDGLSGRDETGTPSDPARADLAARVIAELNRRPELARRLSQVNVHDPRNAAVILSGDPALIQLGEQQFLKRLESYLELAPALRDRIADIDYIDLRFDGRIYVRPAAGKKGGARVSRPRR